jgi:hypothetical protein
MNNMDNPKPPENEAEARAQKTMERCEFLRNQYWGWKIQNMRWSIRVQAAALIFTAAVPVVLLFQGDYVKIVGSGLSALAAIATGLLAINGWRENFIRYGYIYHRLDVEKSLYEARATKEYPADNPKEAAKNFAKRIEGLVMMDVTEWRAEMQRIEEPSQPSEQPTGS